MFQALFSQWDKKKKWGVVPDQVVKSIITAFYSVRAASQSRSFFHQI